LVVRFCIPESTLDLIWNSFGDHQECPIDIIDSENYSLGEWVVGTGRLANGQPAPMGSAANRYATSEVVAERINTSPAGEYVRAIAGSDGTVIVPRGGAGSGRVGF